MRRFTYSRLALLFTLCIVLISSGCFLNVVELPYNHHSYAIDNPYVGIDWATIGYYDGNFHTHTDLSDGQMKPQDVIDTYQELGYSVLALTDHNTSHYDRWPSTLYPWTAMTDIADQAAEESWQDRDPAVLGMVAVQGSEISQHHHIGSWFNGFVGTVQTEQEALIEIADGGGLAILHHPGRYDESDSWYVNLFAMYPDLIGLEIYNQNDRYGEDRERWDRILQLSMPERPVWGFGNDDMHSRLGLGWNRNVLLLPQLSETAVRGALEAGQFFVFKPFTRETAADVKIVDIEILSDGVRLTTQGKINSIQWVTYYSETQSSEVVALGETFSTTTLPVDATFVRAVLYSDCGILYTQPFGMTKLD